MYGMGAISDEDKLDADEAKKVLRRTARMAKPFRRTVAAALAFTALSTLGVVLGPVILGWAIDNGITPPGDTEVLRNAVIFYLLLTVTAYLAARQQYILINRAGEGFLRALRVRVFDHIQKQSLAFFDRNKSGVLVARMTSDVESMGELVQFGLLQFVSAILLVGFALVLALITSWQLTLVGLLVMPVIIVASRKFQRDSNAAYLDVRENIGQNLSTLQEGIAGVRVIQAYAREPEPAVPATRRGVPRRPREHRPEPVDAAGGHRRRPGHPGLRPRARAATPVQAVEPSALRLARPQRAGVDVVLRAGRGRRRHGHRADRRCRRMAVLERRGGRSARSSPSCCCSPSCSNRCSSSRSCTTPCSRQRLHSTSCSAFSTPSPTSRTARANCRRMVPWSSTTSDSGIPPPRPRCCPTCRSRSPMVNVSRSSARPVPASRPSPS